MRRALDAPRFSGMTDSKRTRLALLAPFALVLLAGCAVSAEDTSAIAGEAEDTDSISEAMALDCSKPSPTPSSSCRPDLRGYQTYAVFYPPNNPQNYAPGYYITFAIENGGPVGAGAFDMAIKDQNGNLLKTTHVNSLASKARTSATIHAPWECGWNRVLTIDSGNTVSEISEVNNTSTFHHPCP
jgi:hypothetical protein